MNRKLNKLNNLNKLLHFLENPHSPEEIAKYLGVTKSCAFEYLYELKRQKLIFIFDYEKTGGQHRKIYQKGNRYDEPLPTKLHLSQTVNRKFVPHPDKAAAWLFNKVEL